LRIPLAFLLDRMIRIVSMVAQMAAIATTGFMTRMCDITSPIVAQAPLVRLATQGKPRRRGGAVTEHEVPGQLSQQTERHVGWLGSAGIRTA
jgi:hypothetical protein